jgi:hypothetical protein
MSKILNEVLAANHDYAAGFDKGDLPMPPGRHFAILTCMDARLRCKKIELPANLGDARYPGRDRGIAGLFLIVDIAGNVTFTSRLIAFPTHATMKT